MSKTKTTKPAVTPDGFLVFEPGPRTRAVVIPLVLEALALLGLPAALVAAQAALGVAVAPIPVPVYLLDVAAALVSAAATALAYAYGWRITARHWRTAAETLGYNAREARRMSPVVEAACTYVAEVDHGLTVDAEEEAYEALKTAAASYAPWVLEDPDEEEEEEEEPESAAKPV